MKQINTNGQYIDLSVEELAMIEGGSWVVDVFYLIGRGIGELSKIQKGYDETGQWLA